MVNKLRSLKQRGDTIVEVLFAVVVIGIVLTGAYAVVTHSLLSEQDAQEHSFALGLVQSQVEQLRSYILNNPTAQLPFSVNGQTAGCMLEQTTTPPASLNPVYNAGSVVSPSCKVSGNTPSGANYILNISLINPTTPLPVYQVSVTWTGILSGNPIDKITIPYRVN